MLLLLKQNMIEETFPRLSASKILETYGYVINGNKMLDSLYIIFNIALSRSDDFFFII